MKTGVMSINQASRIALNIYSALFDTGTYQEYTNNASEPTPLEIGNFEQRKVDMERNAWFKCHKVGCTNKCRKKSQKKISIGNTIVNDKSEGVGNQAETDWSTEK